MNYAIRISYGYDNTLENFARYLETPGICQKFAIYEHPCDDKVSRTHVHVLVMQCNVSTDTLKNKVSDALGFRPSGNKDWMFKTVYKPHKDTNTIPVDDNANIYNSKGKYKPKAYYGYTMEELEEFRSKWVSMKSDEQKIEIVDGQFLVNENSQRTLTKRQLLQLMIGKYDSAIAPHENEWDCEKTNKKIFLMIRDVLVAQGEPIGENKVLEYFDSVRMHVRPDKWVNCMYERYCQRYRR